MPVRRTLPWELRWTCALLSLGALACGERSTTPAPARPAPVGELPRARPLASELAPAARAIEERRFAEGRKLAEDFLARHPEDGQAPFLIGLSYYWSENFGAARAWLERAREREPGLHAVHELLGTSLFRLGELAAARRAFDTYLALAPGDPKGHYGLGLIELDETRLAAAAERFRTAIALFDALPAGLAEVRSAERGECHARLGEVHLARDELEAARAELERATTLAPGNISAFYTLSLVYRRLGQEELGERAAERYEAARQALLATQGPAR